MSGFLCLDRLRSTLPLVVRSAAGVRIPRAFARLPVGTHIGLGEGDFCFLVF
jgi:hypothetical protein